jgi:hypothetical protein
MSALVENESSKTKKKLIGESSRMFIFCHSNFVVYAILLLLSFSAWTLPPFFETLQSN